MIVFLELGLHLVLTAELLKKVLKAFIAEN